MISFTKKILLFIGLILMFPSFAAIDSQDYLKHFNMPEGYSEITQNQAYALMQEKNVAILDVRTKAEFDQGHIVDAINLSSTEIDSNTKIEGVDYDTPILIYCRSGRRATDVGQKLVEAGYKYVMNFGGIVTWKYETVN